MLIDKGNRTRYSSSVCLNTGHLTVDILGKCVKMKSDMEERCDKKENAQSKPMIGKVIHYSVDDVYEILQELTEHRADYASIFECKRLAALRELHNKYDAKFSMYCFERADGYHISNVTTKFRAEFEHNSDWLTFGYHGRDRKTKFHEGFPLEEFKKSYENVEQAMIAFAGKVSLCHVIRLHFFMCTAQQKQFLKEKGIVALLASDDARISYDLSEEENTHLCKERLFDKDLFYYKTDIRLEQVTDMQASLRQMEGLGHVVVFTHEYELDNQLEKLEETIRFFARQGYVSSFLA